MEGVTPARTNVYQAQGISRISGLAWKSDQIFAAQYYKKVTEFLNTGQIIGFSSYFEPSFFSFSEPILAGKTLFFRIYLGDSYLIAVDAGTGHTLWNFKVERGWVSVPAVADGIVYASTNTGNFYAIDAHTGQEKWRFKVKGQGASSPLVSRGVVYFGSGGGSFYALDAGTGKQIWEFKAKGRLTPASSVDDLLFVGSSEGYLYALDSKGGTERWHFKFSGEPSTLVCGDGVVYFYTTKGDFYAVDAKTGQQMWSAPTNAKSATLLSALRNVGGHAFALYDKTLYFCRAEKLYALDATTGKQKWEFATESYCRSPVVADGIVYIGGLGKLYAVDAHKGTPTGTLESAEKIGERNVKHVLSSPAVSDGQLYIVSDDGRVYALK